MSHTKGNKIKIKGRSFEFPKMPNENLELLVYTYNNRYE